MLLVSRFDFRPWRLVKRTAGITGADERRGKEMTEGTENTAASAPVDAFVMRLRKMDLPMCDEAADMLEFFFEQMQMHSPDMGGNHSYRFRSGGWPMTHCKGPTAEQAVISAIKEIQRSRSESA